MKNLAILGSTGSIGTQTLDVVRANKDLKVVALGVKSNIEVLEKQAREFKPEMVAVWDEDKAKELEIKLADTDIKVVGGMIGLFELATNIHSDLLVTAIVGMIGIWPTIMGLNAGKDIALANKETLVTAGHLVMPLAKEKGVSIFPVDSEHSAIFQVLHGEQHSDIEKLLITASGGPFRGKKTEDLANVTVEQALAHPNWSMGRKISIDSATLVNKGLEVMEARWLFDVTMDQIEVVVQPQSIIHSMVAFKDGAVLAELGLSDMKIPIQYAIYYPEHRYFPGERLDFATLRKLDFEEPDMETFKGLPLAMEASRKGGSMPIAFNIANEWAVAKFLDRKIGFLDIYKVIEETMEQHTIVQDPDVRTIFEIERDIYSWLDKKWQF
ncbi:MAG: 1-deoxy-D-xylulose-5-phosphate reductoisomerase [Lachnospiraceae bacterium]|nr:1-deoxy-D-xylulose-5-phosphate reductoisomerase [Lachnospiraceae bacterium]